MKFNLFTIAKLALICLGALASADCVMEGEDVSGEDRYVTDGKLCLPTGEGIYTFAMDVSMVAVPSFGDSPFAGVAGNTGFLIMDNTCKILGVYPRPSCEIPWTIEANWLQYVLTIGSVDMNIGDSHFKFYYANGAYEIDVNQCTCVDASDGLQAADACRCAFPVAGEPEKKLRRSFAA